MRRAVDQMKHKSSLTTTLSFDTGGDWAVRLHGPNKVREERYEMFGPNGNAVHDRHAGYFRGRKYVPYAACQLELVTQTKQRRSQCSAVLRASERCSFKGD
jgi:hypothetical protein